MSTSFIEGEIYEGIFPWSTSVVIADDHEFVSPLLFIAVFFVIHGVSFVIFSMTTPDYLCGLGAKKKLVTNPKDKIYKAIAHENIFNELQLEGTYFPLSYSVEVDEGTKNFVTLRPKKGEKGEDGGGPVLVDFEYIEPFVDPAADKGKLPTPVLVPGSVVKRSMTLREERHQWASLLAHQVVSFVAVVALGGIGLYEWFGPSMAPLHTAVADLSQSPDASPATLTQRFYIRYAPGLLIGQLNLAFQAYDLVATLAVKDLRSMVMVVHHILAGLIAFAHCYPHFLGITGTRPWGQYDLVYFMGVTEVSTIPLSIHDSLKHLPEHLKTISALKLADEVSKPLFALLFLAFRCFYFPVVMKGYLGCLLAQLHDNAPETAHAPAPLLLLLISGAVFMSLLQYFWGFKILSILFNIVVGGADAGQKEKKT